MGDAFYYAVYTRCGFCDRDFTTRMELVEHIADRHTDSSAGLGVALNVSDKKNMARLKYSG